MKSSFRTVFSVLIVVALAGSAPPDAISKETIQLTLDGAVEIAMGNSYRIKQLQLGVERNRLWLKSRQASLKSRVYMNLKAPEYKAISDYKWNSTLQRDEIVRENTSLWQMDLAVRQPVILMGRPTNGYLSLNNKTYKYIQTNGSDDINYYNRYYVKYEQPFFLPNELKNDIEDAELDLEDRELDYLRDRMWLVDRISDDYYDLFEYTYRDSIYKRQIENLETIAAIAREAARTDTTRTFDVIQIDVELANTEEEMLKNQVYLRRQEAESKQNLRMSIEDSVYVDATIDFKPVTIDERMAIEHGYSLNPSLRVLDISKRKDEIDVSNAKGWDAFNVTVEMTYGLEKQDDRHQAMWEEYDNSYSASLNAYVPIWDWGRRQSRIEAEEYNLQITELRIEEEQSEIRSDIMTALENLREYQTRTVNTKKSMETVQGITDMSMEQYQQGNISIQDLLQIVSRQKDTEINFLEAYQGYRRSLISLTMQTYYDFENDISLIDKYRAER